MKLQASKMWLCLATPAHQGKQFQYFCPASSEYASAKEFYS